MAFSTIYKDLGRVKAGITQSIHFPYDDTVAAIGSISLSCGCSGASNHPVNREVVISYKPQAVPTHLKHQGFYTSRNHATVSIITKEGDSIAVTLTFQAQVY